LSIGLPVYNGEVFLTESMNSILRQDFGDFELIVSDNASTDGTRAIVEVFALQDPRVRYFRSETNVGAAANFNRAFREAAAPLFKWACADDVLADGFLSAAVAETDRHPDIVVCYGRTTLVDEDGRPLSAFDQGLDLRDRDVASRFKAATNRMGLLHVLQGVMRTGALRTTGLMGSFPGSDEALVVELSLRGPIHEISCPMLFRRIHDSAASAGTTIGERQEHLDPRTRGRLSLWYWRHSIEHLKGIGRAPLPLTTKARLYAIKLRAMVSQRNQLAREARAAAAWLGRSGVFSRNRR